MTLCRLKNLIRSSTSNKGSALLQTLISVGMIGLVSVGLTNYSKNSMQDVQFKATATRASNVGEVIVSAIRHPNNCTPVAQLGAGHFAYPGLGVNDTFTYNSAQSTSALGQAIRIYLPYYPHLGPPRPGLVVPRSNLTDVTDLGTDLGFEVNDLRFRQLLGAEGAPSATERVGNIIMVAEDNRGRTYRRNIGRLSLTLASNIDPTVVGCFGASSLQAYCEESLGGRFDPAMVPSCRFGHPEMMNCAAGQYISAINNGTAVCSNADLNCAVHGTGTYLVGILNGYPDCERFARHCHANPGARTWSQSGNTCTNTNHIYIPHGETWPVGDLTGPLLGHADFTCDDGNITGPAAANSICGAEIVPPPPPPDVTGECGPADGGTFADAAAATTAGLCSAGTLSAPISGTGPWSWACLGSGSGSDSPVCLAMQGAPPPPPPAVCGTQSFGGDKYAPCDSGGWPTPWLNNASDWVSSFTHIPPGDRTTFSNAINAHFSQAGSGSTSGSVGNVSWSFNRTWISGETQCIGAANVTVSSCPVAPPPPSCITHVIEDCGFYQTDTCPASHPYHAGGINSTICPNFEFLVTKQCCNYL